MERIGKAVERELSRSGGGEALALSEITSAWPGVVGETIARNAWPLRLGRDGTLHVATTSATWAFELDRLAPEVMERLAAALGAAAPPKLRFRTGLVPEPGAPENAAVAGPEPPVDETSAAATAIASAVSESEDPELRDIGSRAARASLPRPRSGRGF
jgi:predicted nucleic acid-binding Zn ribbon protein